MSASKQTAFDYIDEKSGVITDVSDKIWDYAELSLREYKSGELYAKVLKEEGFTVEHPFDNIETAFRASYGSGKPVIGDRANLGTGEFAGSPADQSAMSHLTPAFPRSPDQRPEKSLSQTETATAAATTF